MKRNLSLAALLCGAFVLYTASLPGCADPSPADDDSVGADDDTSAINLPPVTFTVGVSINAGPEPTDEWALEVEGAEVDGLTATVPGDGQAHEIVVDYPGYLHAPCSVKVVGEDRALVTVEHAPIYADFYPEVGHQEFPLQDGEGLVVPLNVDATGVWDCSADEDEFVSEVEMVFGEISAYFFEIEMALSGHEILAVGPSGGGVYEGLLSSDRTEWEGTAVADNGASHWDLRCER